MTGLTRKFLGKRAPGSPGRDIVGGNGNDPFVVENDDVLELGGDKLRQVVKK